MTTVTVNKNGRVIQWCNQLDIVTNYNYSAQASTLALVEAKSIIVSQYPATTFRPIHQTQKQLVMCQKVHQDEHKNFPSQSKASKIRNSKNQAFLLKVSIAPFYKSRWRDFLTKHPSPFRVKRAKVYQYEPLLFLFSAQHNQ